MREPGALIAFASWGDETSSLAMEAMVVLGAMMAFLFRRRGWI